MGKRHKKRGRPTFIRDWRKYRGLSQERLADRVGLTQATIARLERGDIAYTQPVLEALGEALTCSPADLIMRPPNARNELVALVEALDEQEREQAVAVIQALKKSGKAA